MDMMIAETRVATSAAQTEPKPRGKQQLDALTGLRFFAAFLVVTFHCLASGRMRATTPSLIRPRTLLQNLWNSGYVGVSFFFILSGFILAYSYLGCTGQPRVDKHKFWVARFARIYPAYVVALVVAVFPFDALDLPLRGRLTVVTLTQAWLPGFQYAWNGPSWSLSAEMFFYLLFPLAAALLIRLDRRRLLITAVGLWLVMLAAVVAYIRLLPDGKLIEGSPKNAVQPWMLMLYTNPLARLPEFLAGVALGRIFGLSGGREQSISRRSARAIAMASVVVVLAITVLLCMGPSTPMLWSIVILDPLFALLIYLIALDRGPLGRFFALTLLVLLGEASYSLYLLHVSLWAMWGRLLPRSHAPALSLYTSFALFAVVAVIASIIVLKLVENPARAWIRAALTPRRRRS
jgi:peptidoglycan/LPS O-acetylase OafA/YrhL